MDPFEKPAGWTVADTNGDDTLTLGDAGEWLTTLFFLPGDWALWLLAAHAAPVARFLEISAADYGGVLSGCIAALAWLALLLCSSIAYQTVREADRALTAAIICAWLDLQRHCRVAVRRLKLLRHRFAAAPVRADVVELGEELELAAHEVQLLRLHASLEPGYSLTTSDLAARFRIRRDQVPRLCARLVQLKLLARTIGGAEEGETSYALTAAGRGLLAFRRLGVERPAAAARSATVG